MSLPSIPQVAEEMNINLLSISSEQAEQILIEAMRKDLPLAVAFLHQQSHNPTKGVWVQDPNSPIGKQLIRLHASDALRPLAEKHFCHEKRLTFVNCCNGIISEFPPTREEIALLQLQAQAGSIAYADC